MGLRHRMQRSMVATAAQKLREIRRQPAENRL